jgi:hypothetical protein
MKRGQVQWYLGAEQKISEKWVACPHDSLKKEEEKIVARKMPTCRKK